MTLVHVDQGRSSRSAMEADVFQSVWNYASAFGLGSLVTALVKNWWDRRVKKEERLFDVRREIYGDLLGTLRAYIRNPENEKYSENLHHLLSTTLLFAGPTLRDHILVCANAAAEVGPDVVPVCLGGTGLAQLEFLMKAELGIPKDGFYRRFFSRFRKCSCGSDKWARDCRMGPKTKAKTP